MLCLHCHMCEEAVHACTHARLPALPAGVKVICFTALQRSVSLIFADVVAHLTLTRGSSGELLGCSYELALQLLLETATSNLRRILEVTWEMHSGLPGRPPLQPARLPVLAPCRGPAGSPAT